MKIFMSHSSRQKLFVKELRRHLPQSMGLWIDERELRVGASVEAELENAVLQNCDFFILVVDSNSNRSDWVRKEIDWAIQREKELNQVFLIPILVEQEAWEEVDPRIRDRKFLTLQDFTEESIAAIGRSLTSEVLEWLSNRLSAERTISPGELERRSNAELIRNADRLTTEIADTVKARLLPYRSANPIELDDFATELRDRGGLDIGSRDELVEVLDRLSAMHLLNGVEYDDEVVFLSRENFEFKANLHSTLKKKMARRAASDIQSGMTIALDGGSSVLKVAEIVARKLRTSALQDLDIVTNSIPAAHLILTELSAIGAGDRDRRARVFIPGGVTRPVSLTTIPVAFAGRTTAIQPPGPEYDAIKEAVGTIDIAFLGANGTYGDDGLGTHNSFETTAKRWMVDNSEQRVVLMDATKLDIPQRVPFASFADALTIITVGLEDASPKIEAFAEKVRGTASTFEVVK